MCPAFAMPKRTHFIYGKPRLAQFCDLVNLMPLATAGGQPPMHNSSNIAEEALH